MEKVEAVPPRAPEVGSAASEMELVVRASAGSGEAFRAIMRMHNQRLFRIARSITRGEGDAEEVLQEAYLKAFHALGSFRGESSLATWLSRIVINEALGRVRGNKQRLRLEEAVRAEGGKAQIIPFPGTGEDPERSVAQRQILQLVEHATDALPDAFRTVFVARAIEGMTIEETAALLGLRPETVRTRLHRARHLIRKRIEEELGPLLLDAFPFAGYRCERLSQAVMHRLGLAG